MYLSDSWCDAKDLRVNTRDATNYTRDGDMWLEVKEDNEVWISLGAGAASISLRLTREQLDTIIAKLGIAYQDRWPVIVTLPERDNTKPDGLAEACKDVEWAAITAKGEVIALCAAHSYDYASDVFTKMRLTAKYDVIEVADMEAQKTGG